MRSLSKQSLVGCIAIVAIIFSLSACAKKKIQPLEELSPPIQKQETIKPLTGETTIAPEEQEKVEIEEGEEGIIVEEKEGEAPEELLTPQTLSRIKELSPLQEKILAFEAKDVYFEFDNFSLSREAKETVIGLSSFLMKNPGLKVRIEGHCDERGTTEYNLALGERRAKSVQDYLIFLGVKPETSSTISYGEEMSIDPRSCEEAWALNRRAHFDIIE